MDYIEKKPICSFFGSLDTKITDEIYAKTKREIINAVNFGCRIFYFGDFGSFEALCHTIVTDLIIKYPSLNMRRIYLTTYKRLSTKEFPNLKNKLPLDLVFCVPFGSNEEENTYLRTLHTVSDSDYLIFYTTEGGNNFDYYAYIRALNDKRKTVVNLYNK